MLKQSLLFKLQNLHDRYEELSVLLTEPEVIQDSSKYVKYSKEYSELKPIIDQFQDYKNILKQLDDTQELQSDPDPELRALGQTEFENLTQKLSESVEAIQVLLLPQDPDDEADIYLEIRAGTGGDEAAIFAGDLFRMYSRFVDRQHWKLDLMSSSSSEKGGFKEIIVQITGERVYQYLKYESGVHRVQRVPATESQGRVHTSACTVAILPVVEAIGNAIEIDPKDLRIDTFRASGAGGQHVNRTDSAVRITRIPSGTVVECQDDRSQHKNKAKAMAFLQAKLLVQAKQKQDQEQAAARKNLVGSGDRSERIRTYNYPQGRLTDHRINLTLYRLPEILEGDLSEIIDALRREDQLEKLSQLDQV